MKLNEKVWSNLPTFKKLVEEGEVKRFTNDEMLDLTEENKLKIKEFDDTAKKLKIKSKIIAVTEQTSYICGDCLNMTCYIILDSQSKPWIINDGTVGFFANVVNHEWDIEEMGSVGLKEIDGLIKRVM